MRLLRSNTIFFFVFQLWWSCLFSGFFNPINAQESDTTSRWHKPEVNGYVKYLPSVRFSNDFKENFSDQLLHNRINVHWKMATNIHFQGALRTRLFYGETVETFPFYADFVAMDPGWLQPSWIVLEQGKFLAHTTSDRFFLDFSKDKWHVRVGRQRINWGVNMVSNPNDLFNTYSFFDFDYEERPGTDAVRIQYFSGPLSRFELAYSPADTWQEQVVAGMYAMNWKGYDVQFSGGVFNNRATKGLGWAGNIKQTGFKGEINFFHDLRPSATIDPWNIVAALSIDHLFNNGSFIMGEYLFNQIRPGEEAELFLLTQPLRADNLSFTDHALLINYTYPLNMRWTIGAAGIYYPRESGMFLSPSAQWSAAQNIDVLLISQLFFGSDKGILSQAGYLLAGAVKWSF